MAIDSIVWVSGAMQGIGAPIARNVPYDNARVINISRRQHSDLETVVADISEPAAWDRIATHFVDNLQNFDGARAIFVHCAFDPSAIGPAGAGDAASCTRNVLANSAAPIVLADSFIRAIQGGTFEACLSS